MSDPKPPISIVGRLSERRQMTLVTLPKDFKTGVEIPDGVVVVLAFLGWRACDNDAQCKRQHCEAGKPMLVKGECVCVGEARP